MSISDIFSWMINVDIRVYIGFFIIMAAIGSFQGIPYMPDKEGKWGPVKSFFEKLFVVIFLIAVGVGGATLIYFYW